MSQRSQKKRRFTLQIIFHGMLLTLLILMSGCTIMPVQSIQPIHYTSGEKAQTLRYANTLNEIGLGSEDYLTRIIAGEKVQDIKQPTAIGIRDHLMFIADVGSGLIYKYDFNKKRMVILNGVGDRVQGEVSDIYVARDYSFYVTDVLAKRVLHFSESGSLLKIFSDAPNLSSPISVFVDEDAKEVLVADENFSHIVAFNYAGEPVYGMGSRGEGPGKFRIITDMIPIEEGFLVSDRIEYSVQVLDRQGKYITHFGEGDLLFPTALAMDKYGRVYVAEKAESVIKVFKNGKVIDVIGRNGYGRGEFRHISDMKIAKDQLYVVDNLNGRIQIFDILSANQVSLLQ